MLNCAGPGAAPAVSSRLHSMVIIRLPRCFPERQVQQATYTSKLWTWTIKLSKKIFQILVTERSLNLNSGLVCRGNGSSTLLLYCRLHRVQLMEIGWDSLTIHYQQKGENLPKPPHSPLLLSQCFWVCMPIICHQSLSERIQPTSSRKKEK